LQNLSESDLNLPETLEKLEIENHPDFLRLSFERNADDRLLGETISLLTGKGAKILDVETEKPTLLDVLESYE
jgi:hypothetical protein